jgi:hypothetical protein
MLCISAGNHLLNTTKFYFGEGASLWQFVLIDVARVEPSTAQERVSSEGSLGSADAQLLAATNVTAVRKNGIATGRQPKDPDLEYQVKKLPSLRAESK